MQPNKHTQTHILSLPYRYTCSLSLSLSLSYTDRQVLTHMLSPFLSLSLSQTHTHTHTHTHTRAHTRTHTHTHTHILYPAAELTCGCKQWSGYKMCVCVCLNLARNSS